MWSQDWGVMIWAKRMNAFTWMGMVSVTVLIAATSTSLAQPPPGEMCGQVTTVDGEAETSIQTCMSELLDEQLKMIDGIEEMGREMRATYLSLLSARGASQFQRSVLLDFMAGDPDNIQLMRDQVQRATEENAAVEDADYDDAFEKADQKKGKNCKLSDIPFVESLGGDFPAGLKPVSGDEFDRKFGDGKCNVFKARIDNPGEPDHDEVVNVNEQSENMCERACADRESDSNFAELSGPKRKDERKDRTVFALTDNIAAARRANDDLDTSSARISTLRIQLSSEVFRLSEDQEDSCEPLDAARILDEIAEGVGLAKNAVAIVTVSLELAKETARPPSKQDAAGFNASTAETPFSVATGVSKIVEESLGFIEQGFKVAALIQSRHQDFAQAECSKTIKDDTEELKLQVGKNAAEIALIKAIVEETREFLLTPTGRREGFQD